jgi:hypothetical protein
MLIQFLISPLRWHMSHRSNHFLFYRRPSAHACNLSWTIVGRQLCTLPRNIVFNGCAHITTVGEQWCCISAVGDNACVHHLLWECAHITTVGEQWCCMSAVGDNACVHQLLWERLQSTNCVASCLSLRPSKECLFQCCLKGCIKKTNSNRNETFYETIIWICTFTFSQWLSYAIHFEVHS